MRKAIEHAKQKKEHELRFSDEGITELSATYPELCKKIVSHNVLINVLIRTKHNIPCTENITQQFL